MGVILQQPGLQPHCDASWLESSIYAVLYGYQLAICSRYHTNCVPKQSASHRVSPTKLCNLQSHGKRLYLYCRLKYSITDTTSTAIFNWIFDLGQMRSNCGWLRHKVRRLVEEHGANRQYAMLSLELSDAFIPLTLLLPLISICHYRAVYYPFYEHGRHCLYQPLLGWDVQYLEATIVVRYGHSVRYFLPGSTSLFSNPNPSLL